MKVIDLLNKIANGEEVPKNVILDKKEFQYNKTYEQYLDKYEVNLLEHISDYNYSGLNDEVEIIEETKEIEEIEIFRNEETGEGYFIMPKHTYFDNIDLNNAEAELCFVVNELIKEVNELKKGK